MSNGSLVKGNVPKTHIFTPNSVTPYPKLTKPQKGTSSVQHLSSVKKWASCSKGFKRYGANKIWMKNKKKKKKVLHGAFGIWGQWRLFLSQKHGLCVLDVTTLHTQGFVFLKQYWKKNVWLASLDCKSGIASLWLTLRWKRLRSGVCSTSRCHGTRKACASVRNASNALAGAIQSALHRELDQSSRAPRRSGSGAPGSSCSSRHGTL